MNLKIRFRQLGCTIFEYLFIIVIILNCRSMWSSLVKYAWFNNLMLILLACSVLGYMISLGAIERKVLASFLSISIVAVGYIGIYLIQNKYGNVPFVKYIVGMLLVLLFCMVYRTQNKDYGILEKYENIILMICLISLFFWICASNLGMIHYTGMVDTNWSGEFGVTKSVRSYYGLYFEAQKLNFLGLVKVVRNTGFFTEAPMCSLHFSIALLVELCLKRHIKLFNVIVLSLGIISTFSTTGLIVLVAVFFMKVAFKKANHTSLIILKIVIVPILIFITGYVAIELFVSKMTIGTSGSTRLDDFVAGYKAWMDSPIFGNGFTNEYSIINHMNMSVRGAITNVGFSNSPMKILALGGIYLFLPFLVSIIGGIKQCVKGKNWNYTIFYFLFIFMFIITLIPFQYLPLLVLFLFAL